MKKIGILLLAGMISLALAGCGQNPKSDSPVEVEPSSAETLPDTAPAPDETSSADHETSTSTSTGTGASTSSFTNDYGTSSTKCAHPGCSNYIASSGDTNCCTTHSNKCLECGRYVDEDAMYCMRCLSAAAGSASSSGSSSYGSSSSGSYASGSSSGKGAGGYDMPKEGETFSDYVQRVDPELYDSLFE